MTAPVPSDIDGPAGEAGDLIERKVWRRVRDDGRVTFWETEVPDGELFVPAARLAALQQERDELKELVQRNYNLWFAEKMRAEASEALAAALRMALGKLANEVAGLKATEFKVRNVIGDTNWNVLMLREDEARAVLTTTLSAHEEQMERLTNAVTACRPIIERLIAAEHNVETWGLKQRLAAIDAALAKTVEG